METIYSPDLRAELTLDEHRRVRQVAHTEYFPSEAATPRLAAGDYLRHIHRTLEIPAEQLQHLHQQVSFLDPREQEVQYRLAEVKKFFRSATYCYYQTIHNTPVWDGGLTVTVKEAPFRITAADHRGHADLALDLPPKETIDRVRNALARINRVQGDLSPAVVGERAEPPRPKLAFSEAFAAVAPSARRRAQTNGWLDGARIKRGVFYVYRYRGKDRQPAALDGKADGSAKGATVAVDLEATDRLPTLPLPAVPERIREGRHYLVAEIVFSPGREAKTPFNWKALVEIETGAILWLRPMIAGVDALVFTYDPKTSTGDLTNTPDDANGILNPLRDPVTLSNLNPPMGGTQSLSGTNVSILDDDSPAIAPPTRPVMSNFDYDARTDAFSAVNAYYHADNVFDVIESLGFDLGTYFNGTSFPVHIDHRASTSDVPGAGGVEVNAFCSGDAGSDGIGLVGFCLSDTTDTTNPLGRAVDKWVHWHEIGGHGILWDHVNSPNFGFAHSAGDSLAAFQNDPESLLRGLPQRFQYAPFRNWPAGSDRWFNRAVADGWGWGGPNDTGGYASEQVLASTMFRMYQSLGGDAAQVAKRWHASRVATYLVLNAVGKLMPGANANTPGQFHDKLRDADADDWSSEGLAGGAYRKVIRWAFEKQGLFRAPGAPVTDPGAPPAVDLYIDDGRGGEYQYLANHWSTQAVWNRTAADGVFGQQPGVAGVESHAYVKVRNRGTTNASGTVKVYHCLPGSGLTWPTDFVQARPPAGLPTGDVLANNGNEVVVGPFAWTPNVNAYGHDCLLAVVESDQDPSNVANFGPGETIQEWRLVPHDNNIGQRNVPLVPGGGGGEALAASLDGAFFMAGNNFNKPARMELHVALPPVLASKGWRLGFTGLESNTFLLKAGEKRKIELRLVRGSDFTPDEIRGTADRVISVAMHGNGMPLGGMSYYVDPDMTEPAGGRPQTGDRCKPAAQGLLDCLHLGRGQTVSKVCVKKVSLDIELEDDCSCD